MTSLVWEIELTGTDDFEITVVPELQSVYLADQSDIGTTTRLKLRRFDMTSGQKLDEFPMRACVNAVSFSPDHSTILTNSNKRIYLLDSKALKEISRWDSRVPSGMTSIVKVHRDVAMKDRIGKNICLYNLDTSVVRRIPVGIGRPLFRDIRDDTVLACCELDGRVCRVDPVTKTFTTLFQGPPFNSCFVDYKTKTLWLGEGLIGGRPGYYREITGRPAPAVNNSIHAVSLESGSPVGEYHLEFEFQALSVSKGAQFIWVRPESHDNSAEVRILSTVDKLTEVARFKIPNAEYLMYADAPTGLIFTAQRSARRSNEAPWLLLKCRQT
jgi:hypothetical protein